MGSRTLCKTVSGAQRFICNSGFIYLFIYTAYQLFWNQGCICTTDKKIAGLLFVDYKTQTQTANTDINENTRLLVRPEDTEPSNLLLLMNCTFHLQVEDCVISFFKHAERVPSGICVYEATVVLHWDTVKISNEL